MEVKAIRDLAQLSDHDLFIQVSTGLRLVAKNVAELYEGTSVLAEQGRLHAGRVLANPIGPETHCTEIFALNSRTLELMESRGQLAEQPPETYQSIARDWQFPMYGLDLSMVDVDLETLRERQRNWSPEDY